MAQSEQAPVFTQRKPILITQFSPPISLQEIARIKYQDITRETSVREEQKKLKTN